MRDVVFLTYAYPPLRYPRSIQIYRLVKYSRHRIRVVCAEPEPERDDSIDERLSGRPAEQIVVQRPRGRFEWPRLTRRFAVPDAYRGWARAAADRILRDRLITADDTLVTFGNPMSDHVAGLEIRRALGVRWVAHFSDPWADNPYRRLPPIARRIDRRLERDVIAGADRVVFTTAETVDLVMAKYPPAWRAKTLVLPHAFDPELFDGGPVERTAGRPGILGRHIGSLYVHRKPDPLTQALWRLGREQPGLLAGVRIELVGHVASAIETAAPAPATHDAVVRFAPRVDYRSSIRLMRESDFLLVIDAPFDRSVFLPSKLIEYVGAARPILAITPPGAAAALVRRLGGFVADARDMDAVADQLRAMLSFVRGRRARTFGEPAVRAEFAAPKIVADFDAIIDELSRC